MYLRPELWIQNNLSFLSWQALCCLNPCQHLKPTLCLGVNPGSIYQAPRPIRHHRVVALPVQRHVLLA